MCVDGLLTLEENTVNNVKQTIIEILYRETSANQLTGNVNKSQYFRSKEIIHDSSA